MGNQLARAESGFTVFVNGERRTVDVDPATPLASWLRTSLSMTGTKVGCGTGYCGACTVMVSRFEDDEEGGSVRHFTANACLMPVCAVDHCHVTTVEGSDAILQRVKEAFFAAHATQCGFCTPGFVMSVYCQLRNNPDISPQELIAALDGNLCRCSGMRSVVDAAKSLCPCGMDEGGCCQAKDGEKSSEQEQDESVPARSGEFIFPPFLRLNKPTDLVVTGMHTTFVRPTTLALLQSAVEKYGARIKILGGATSPALRRCPDNVVLLSGAHVPELREISLSHGGSLTMGSYVTLAETQEFLLAHKDSFLAHHPLGALFALLSRIASTQVRSMATWGGAVGLCEPNSDLLALLAAVGTEVHVMNRGKQTTLSMQQLMKGAFQTSLKQGDVLTSLYIPPPQHLSYCASYKFSPRGQLSRAIVGGTAVLRLNAAGTVQSLSMALIGVDLAQVSLFALDALKGVHWDMDAAEKLLEASRSELHPVITGEQEQYRKYLVDALLFEFLTTSSPLFGGKDAPAEKLVSVRAMVTSSQSYGDGALEWRPVGEPVPHHSGLAQTHGLAKFCDDEGASANLLYCVPVLSKSARATFEVQDDAEVRKMPGVVDVLYAKDIRGKNFANSEQGYYLADKETHYWGQPLALVIASSMLAALRASFALGVTYKHEEAPIVTLEQAITSKSEHEWAADDGMSQHLWHGDVAAAKPARTFESSVLLAASEHLYMEPHSCTVVPNENNSEYTVTGTTQNLAALVVDVANVTGVAQNRISAQCKRLGGGFGGKGITALALPAIAAAKLNRPVRQTLTRFHDMVMSTKRGESKASWKVGVNESGTIESLEITIWYAAGWFRNNMHLIPHLMAVSGMGSYSIPNFSCRLHCMKLNRAMTGPFRGAGIPQGCFVLETILERTAVALGVDGDEFRRRHMRLPSPSLQHLGAPVTGRVTQSETLARVVAMSKFEERKAAVAQFNAGSKFVKRGLALQVCAHPIGSKNAKALHQGRGVVHVATDGTVTIGHQGIEMGQGIHTKMCQVVAHELGVPLSSVRVATNSTDMLGHTMMETGGSVGSEVNAAALIRACAKVRKNKAKICRLNKLDDAATSLAQAASLAVDSRIALTGWACVGTLFPAEEASPIQMKYWVYGSSVVECEVDVRTGAYGFLHASCCLDVGRSLNPAIDIGQLEGGFVMGLSWATREQILYREDGSMATTQLEKYLIATADCIPRDFHVALLPDSDNEANRDVAYGSKAVGEPPVSLAVAGHVALQRAVRAAGGKGSLSLPATHEALRLAIGTPE